MRPPQPEAVPRRHAATGRESPGRAQLACSIVRVVGCLHADVSSPWPTHGWSDVWRSLTLARPSGRWAVTAAAGIAIRSASCQQPRVAARWRSSSDWPLRRRSTASPPIRPAQLLQLLLSAVSLLLSHAPHSPHADCAPRQAGHVLMQTMRELGCAA